MVADKNIHENGSLWLISRMAARTLPSDEDGFLSQKPIRNIIDNQTLGH